MQLNANDLSKEEVELELAKAKEGIEFHRNHFVSFVERKAKDKKRLHSVRVNPLELEKNKIKTNTCVFIARQR